MQVRRIDAPGIFVFGLQAPAHGIGCRPKKAPDVDPVPVLLAPSGRRPASSASAVSSAIIDASGSDTIHRQKRPIPMRLKAVGIVAAIPLGAVTTGEAAVSCAGRRLNCRNSERRSTTRRRRRRPRRRSLSLAIQMRRQGRSDCNKSHQNGQSERKRKKIVPDSAPPARLLQCLRPVCVIGLVGGQLQPIGITADSERRTPTRLLRKSNPNNTSGGADCA